jgi:hypothetical protein
MAMWVLFLCALLSTLCHPAMALLDHDWQVVAYNCGKPTDMTSVSAITGVTLTL